MYCSFRFEVRIIHVSTKLLLAKQKQSQHQNEYKNNKKKTKMGVRKTGKLKKSGTSSTREKTVLQLKSKLKPQKKNRRKLGEPP